MGRNGGFRDERLSLRRGAQGDSDAVIDVRIGALGDRGTLLLADDLTRAVRVEETRRGEHIGKTLYNAVLDFAREHGCYNVTLNVWSCNESAMKFYRSCGLQEQKVGMEVIL